ncbi:unnamed protein product [Blepharisma stoltei]|uniref:Uncharacterized protein n=1 Tax=Blepharisma stoltei TaxID=1481888 RepID=A0AAU9IJ07_9CILI|nr:unnamed protein product [Blepharisma stoltei]
MQTFGKNIFIAVDLLNIYIVPVQKHPIIIITMARVFWFKNSHKFLKLFFKNSVFLDAIINYLNHKNCIKKILNYPDQIFDKTVHYLIAIFMSSFTGK